MFKWKIERSLSVLDIEATGTSVRTDRIVELAIVVLNPDNSRRILSWRVNPEMHIPEEATLIHGITDADVAGCPVFRQIAPDVSAALEKSDIAGYNVIRFDIPLLQEEFGRAGVPFDAGGRCIIDAQRIYHMRERRDLTAALAFYCGEMHLAAHGAQGDAEATLRVIEGQFLRYPDLPRDLRELHEYCNPRDPDWVDSTGRLRWLNGVVTINFGRKKGTPLADIIASDPGFVKWMLRGDFPSDTLEIVRKAVGGEWPEPPKPAQPAPCP